MLRRTVALIIGLAVGGALGFAAGYNQGRGEPILSNPFAEPDLATRVQRDARDLLDEARERVHEATR